MQLGIIYLGMSIYLEGVANMLDYKILVSEFEF